jgi:HD-like signal output (HDOD) protein
MIESQIKQDDPTWSADTAVLLQILTEDLANGRVQLPAFPEVVLRVQRTLADERAGIEQITEAVSAEPTLAMQVMRMANSAAYNTTSQQVRDLRAAVQRIGSSVLRAAALSFAVEQLRNVDHLRGLRERLNALWRRGVVVGAIAKAVAARMRTVPPDTALLAGLLHVVGRLYILSRLHRVPRVMDEPGVVEAVMDQVGNEIGKTLLETWEMPAEFGNALVMHGDPDRDLNGPLVLADILAAAIILADLLPPSRADYLDQIQLASVFAQTEPLWQHLNMTREHCSDVLHAALHDVQHLRAQFGS